jgi:hypothetical protein
MNIPGFTAGSSLYTTTEYYRRITHESAETAKRGVIPQFHLHWWDLPSYCLVEVCQFYWHGLRLCHLEIRRC